MHDFLVQKLCNLFLSSYKTSFVLILFVAVSIYSFGTFCPFVLAKALPNFLVRLGISSGTSKNSRDVTLCVIVGHNNTWTITDGNHHHILIAKITCTISILKNAKDMLRP